VSHVAHWMVIMKFESNLCIRIKRVGPVEVAIPRYQSDGAAGMDLEAAIKEPIALAPLERAIVPTGLAIAIPRGWEGQVRPRSGLAAKHGVTVINSPGTIDSDYRGQVHVPLVNLSNAPVTIEPRQRIAQIVFARHGVATVEEADDLDETVRGDGAPIPHEEVMRRIAARAEAERAHIPHDDAKCGAV